MKYYSAYRYHDEEIDSVDLNKEYLQVNCAGCYHMEDKDYCITHRKKGRKDYLLIYTHSGSSMVRFGKEERHAGAGTVYMYEPGQEQYYGQIKNVYAQCYWICFSGHGVRQFLQQLNLNVTDVMDIGVNKSMAAIFDTIIHEIIKKTDYYESYTAILIQQLMYKIAILKKTDANRKILKGNENILDSMNFINMNYDKKIIIKDLAKESNLCVSRYIQIFKEMTGLTPKEYLMNVRIEKACEFLSYTNLGIKEIALSIGFDDQMYFSRVFKKYKGLNPSEYRKTKI